MTKYTIITGGLQNNTGDKEEPYYDDCPICKAMKKAEEEHRK